jgi:hypothetical protein
MIESGSNLTRIGHGIFEDCRLLNIVCIPTSLNGEASTLFGEWSRFVVLGVESGCRGVLCEEVGRMTERNVIDETSNWIGDEFWEGYSQSCLDFIFPFTLRAPATS